MRNPKFISLDDGSVGRFIRTEKVSDVECDVLFTPSGIGNIIKIRSAIRVRRVPISAVHGPYFVDGCPEGVVILSAGSFGESKLLDKLNLDIQKDLTRLEREKAQIIVETEFKESRIQDLRKGHREALKEVVEAQNIFEKVRRQGTLDRRRLPPPEEY